MGFRNRWGFKRPVGGFGERQKGLLKEVFKTRGQKKGAGGIFIRGGGANKEGGGYNKRVQTSHTSWGGGREFLILITHGGGTHIFWEGDTRCHTQLKQGGRGGEEENI